MKPAVLVDTGVLLAVVLPDDARHADAVRILEESDTWKSAHTTDHVVAEALNFVRQKVKRKKVADDLVDLVFGSDTKIALIDHVHRVHSGRFAAALARYRSEFQRGLSFTDWTSVVVADELGLDAIATFDKGFRGLLDVRG